MRERFQNFGLERCSLASEPEPRHLMSEKKEGDIWNGEKKTDLLYVFYLEDYYVDNENPNQARKEEKTSVQEKECTVEEEKRSVLEDRNGSHFTGRIDGETREDKREVS